jgi:cytochrome c oxidase cbb3-type subunit III
MADHAEVDSHSGTSTTGHQWDGIKELNTPLPRWWVWLFYITIIWAFGYWVVYPSWPLVHGYAAGVLGYSSRAQVAVDLGDLQKVRGEKAVSLQQASLADIESDPALMTLARAQGRAAFGNNCAPCHGTGASGARGYPNLNDDDWLWGGKLADISRTIQFGIRAAHPDTRQSQMPAFGRDGLLKRPEIENVADFVRSLSKLPVDPKANMALGARVFADNCASCHGEKGQGNREFGAPNLTDGIWLYGSGREAIIEVISNGRNGVMPAWTGRLDDTTIKALTVYVHTFGGGEK